MLTNLASAGSECFSLAKFMAHSLQFNPERRLEEGATTKDTLYLAERQAHDQTKKVFSEAQEVNQELLGKVEEANKNVEHLLEDVERSVSFIGSQQLTSIIVR